MVISMAECPTISMTIRGLTPSAKLEQAHAGVAQVVQTDAPQPVPTAQRVKGPSQGPRFERRPDPGGEHVRGVLPMPGVRALLVLPGAVFAERLENDRRQRHRPAGPSGLGR